MSVPVKRIKVKVHFSNKRLFAKKFAERGLYVSPIFALALLHLAIAPQSSILPIVPLMVTAAIAIVTTDLIIAIFGGTLVAIALVSHSIWSGLVNFPGYVFGSMSQPSNFELVLAILAIGLIQGAIMFGLGTGLTAMLSTRRPSASTFESLVFFLGVPALFDDYFSYYSRAPFLRFYGNSPGASDSKMTSIIVLSSLAMPSLVLASSWGIYFLTIVKTPVQYVGGLGLEVMPFPLFQVSVMGVLLIIVAKSVIENRHSTTQTIEEGTSAPKVDLEEFPFTKNKKRTVTFLLVGGILPYAAPFAIIIASRNVLTAFIESAPLALLGVFAARLIEGYWGYLDRKERWISDARAAGLPVDAKSRFKSDDKLMHLEQQNPAYVDLMELKEITWEEVLRIWRLLKTTVGEYTLPIIIFIILLLVERDAVSQLGLGNFMATILAALPLTQNLLPVLAFVFAAMLAMSVGSAFFALGLLVPIFQTGQDPVLNSIVLGATMSGAVFGNAVSEFSDVWNFHKIQLETTEVSRKPIEGEDFAKAIMKVPTGLKLNRFERDRRDESRWTAVYTKPGIKADEVKGQMTVICLTCFCACLAGFALTAVVTSFPEILFVTMAATIALAVAAPWRILRRFSRWKSSQILSSRLFD